MSVEMGFNAAEYEPTKAMEPMPTGWYNIIIQETQLVPTNDRSGSYIEIQTQVVDGHYQNRKVWTRLNINNANEASVKMAYGHLRAICDAFGIHGYQNTAELHNKPLKAYVKLVPAKGQYPAKNDIGAFNSLHYNPEAEVAGAAQTPLVQAPPTPPAQPAQPAQAMQQYPVQPPQTNAAPGANPAPIGYDPNAATVGGMQPAQVYNPNEQPVQQQPVQAAQVLQQEVPVGAPPVLQGGFINTPWENPPANQLPGQPAQEAQPAGQPVIPQQPVPPAAETAQNAPVPWTPPPTEAQ